MKMTIAIFVLLLMAGAVTVYRVKEQIKQEQK